VGNPQFHNLLICKRMPIFRSSSQPSRAQRLFSTVATIVIVSAGCVFGLWEAYSCAQEAFGYAAGYSYAIAFSLGIYATVLGLLLCIYWRTRRVGIGLIASGILSYVLFQGGIVILTKMDRVAWRHEPPLERFGPDQKVALVIYFRMGTADRQIEDFDTNILEEPAEPRHSGRDYPAFVSSYLRLPPSQANGFEGAAVNFFNNSPTAEKNAYIVKIRADQRVAKVFTDVSPETIRLDSNVKQ